MLISHFRSGEGFSDCVDESREICDNIWHSEVYPGGHDGLIVCKETLETLIAYEPDPPSKLLYATRVG